MVKTFKFICSSLTFSQVQVSMKYALCVDLPQSFEETNAAFDCASYAKMWLLAVS